MNLKKYEAFIKTIETGSITAAAEQMGNTQSGITQLISSLEKEFGVTLFLRKRTGPRLTQEGERLYPLIRAVVDSEHELEQAVNRIKKNDRVIRISSFKSVAVNWLPDIIKEYTAVEPDVSIELADSIYNNLERTFSEQKVDFCFVPLPADISCRTMPICKDRLLAVLPADFDDSRLMKSSSGEFVCPVSVFEKNPVISLTDSIDRDARTVFESAHVKANIRYRVEDDYVMLAMVEKGLGISIVPELILRGNDKSVKVVELDPPAFRTIGIAFPPGKKENAAALRFAEFAAEWVNRQICLD